ncbi:hypothetical protein CALVIDRAFT_531040 [Calocera viscosa TUFC12733]|uniref:Uncharacterized protein n=1 Tax=Calocera viscosa (strain TUFC12733) TaxID=1330018 RepID=A0A167H272_CALVF|nr:hypothetical protein CALVIDRAFT_531040 [Calocera viscosa TUFC12733]
MSRYSTQDRDTWKRRDEEANAKEMWQRPCLGHMTMILEQIAEWKGKDRQKVYNVEVKGPWSRTSLIVTQLVELPQSTVKTDLYFKRSQYSTRGRGKMKGEGRV